ncbi:MAG: aspartyl protease family protein [Chloroflexota bacterium]
MTTVRTVADAVARWGKAATRLASRRPRRAAGARPGWDAWRAGDFAVAREHAAGLVAAGQVVDEARHLLVLVASVLGEYDEAIAKHRLIDPRYRCLPELDEPVLWAHIHGDDIAGALAFAERRGLGRRGAVTQRLRLVLANPLKVEIGGVVDVPFTDDALTPLMPGFTALLNGRPTVARLDTGGSFIHITSEAAAAFGVETVFAEREFAALRWHTVRHGFADLELGPIRLHNVPVMVHEGALQTGPIAAAFGVELGPIIGTNVLERSLTTVDAPGRRLLLSRRGDAEARAAHLAQLDAAQHEAPFALWSDHLMIARGRVGGVPDANLFVDSGLVAFTAEQGQAAVLASRGALSSWGLALPADGSFAELPGPLAIGPAARDGLTAYSIPDPTWRDFGAWGGIRVDALVSWGFLRHFSWTIDFDRRRYLFGEAPGQPA